MITLLTTALGFPDPETADPGGLLAVGGDLSIRRLVEAYSHGIFPWYNEDHPILWWSPDPRPILVPNELRLDARFRRYLRGHPFELSVDTDFQAVISACATAERHGQAGTWLTDDMIRAYVRMHHSGYAHSIECRLHGRLVGGIYGVAVGRAFFGESMFHDVGQASKVALVHLVLLLEKLKYSFMDCQQSTPHVMRLGAREIPRLKFTRLVEAAAALPGEIEGWRSQPWWNDPIKRREFLHAR
ncbi:MAG: leucyl/phenylalanyl-tRNA--protein transferase [Desulfovibrio sp.]|nr:leucyl/phenylalanyl-tRNA--protein transferase [Desulfovibrio sp.]MBI4960577.1 leucyl/phenylalanyl-tRNA--protein transferase [Desulfovibrio sp.]